MHTSIQAIRKVFENMTSKWDRKIVTIIFGAGMAALIATPLLKLEDFGKVDGTPQHVTAQVVTSTQVDLSWSSPVKLAGYKIIRNGRLIDTVTSGTSYTDVTVEANVTYKYNVIGYDSIGNISPKSLTVTATTIMNTDQAYGINNVQ